ncbi:molybdopterin-containing oxidoreductase family protein [Maridesulfovibrio bastinii]|uniref:molybdopterin-containing oxidoreductase family protein n=1 Tax=Maridesulfovibrio bastinii TaxID=47157 RepID=UPI000402B6BB|nr:molybdopterin-dependent oxidoreductase [Maridesulfovibrio bastinii]
MQIKKTICPYDCPTSCSLQVTTDGTKIIKVRGDTDDPVTGGLICRKMQHYEKSVNSSERILTPLKRTGAKGSGEFKPISWAEAVTEITENWKTAIADYGPQAILPVYYSGVMGLIQRNCGEALFNRMGACTLVKTLCSSAKDAGYKAVAGSTGCLDPRELSGSDYYIIWGSNMKATRLQSMPHIVKARKNGKKIVLIEAYANEMASYCDQVILITPGTDGALALAMMHVLEKEGLADSEFLKTQAEGYSEFRETLENYTPEWAEKITGVPAEVIVKLAREFGAVKAPAIILGSGNSRYGNGGMTVRLITILSAFTGAWNKKGGGYCGSNPNSKSYVDKNRITRPDLRSNSARFVNINKISSALNGEAGESPIKCLHVYACNPVASVADQQGIVKGMSRADLFTVVHERFMTDTARYADIILPATFSVEQSDCHTAYGYCSFGVSRKVVPAPGECKSNWDIFCMLAEGMGFDDDHFKRSEDDLLDELLANPMSGLQEISESDKKVFAEGGTVSIAYSDHTDWQTPSGKLQIINNSLEDKLPVYRECYGGDYPLKLISVPSSETLNSIFLERDELMERRGEMTLQMHPADAEARGISDGDSIVACNEQGKVVFTAALTPLIARGAVAAVGVFKTMQSANGNLVNTLHHERLSDIGEATTMNDNTVEIRKA